MSEDAPKYYPVKDTPDYWLSKISKQLEEIMEQVKNAKELIREGKNGK